MSKFLKDYSLSLVLFTLFLLSLLGQYVFQVIVEGETVAAFLAEMLANWQSEAWQLFTFVVLSTYLIHRNSPQSRDGDDKLQHKVDTLHRMISEIHEGSKPAPGP